MLDNVARPFIKCDSCPSRARPVDIRGSFRVVNQHGCTTALDSKRDKTLPPSVVLDVECEKEQLHLHLDVEDESPPASAVAHSPHPHLKYMSVMGFNPGPMQGWVNFGLQAIGDGNCKFGHDDCNMTGVLDAWDKYRIPSIYGNIPAIEFGQELKNDTVFIRRVGLAPDWEQNLEQVVKTRILPYLGEGKALRGVFLGDEVCCMNTTCWDVALRPATEKLRALVGPETLIYTK